MTPTLAPDRIRAFTGGILADQLDDELQRIVREASDAVETPIALVSLVLEQIQLFRAHVGLPEDLEVSRATDRDISFCQFVVRDGRPFEVQDAPSDDRVPRALVESHGIRSYLGYPVRLGEEVLGSLCVIDGQPRSFSPAEHKILSLLADRASTRLSELAREASPPVLDLLEDATRPAFAEMRNVLTILVGGSEQLRIASVELAPVQRLLQSRLAPEPLGRGLTALRGSASAFEGLGHASTVLGEATDRLCRSVAALEESARRSGSPIRVTQLVLAAENLSFHSLKLVGGIDWTMDPVDFETLAPAPIAIGVLTAVQNALCARLSERGGMRGLAGSMGIEGDGIILALRAPDLPGEDLDRIVRELPETGPIDVRAGCGAVRISLPLARPDQASE